MSQQKSEVMTAVQYNSVLLVRQYNESKTQISNLNVAFTVSVI